MDENLGSFLSNFNKLVSLAQQHESPIEGGDQMLRTLAEYLGQRPEGLAVVVESIPGHRMADLDIALKSISSRDPEARLLGIGGGDQRNHSMFSELLQMAKTYHQFPLAQPDFSNVAVGPDQQRKIVSFGLRLFSYNGAPVVALQRDANPRFGREQATVEVLTTDPDAASALLAELRRTLETESVYKGHVIALMMSEYGPSMGGISFIRRPDINRSDVILPDGVLDRVENHTLEIGRQAPILRASGQHLKRGILLYGPPGTGKTHTVRYLLSQSVETTVVLLSGTSLARITEASRLAKALAPSIVVLEDCDLIAEDRDFSMGPQPLLFEVLDAMDGLDSDADVSFILTTNRVETLERALAQRPGRVDLAVEIPLPSEAERLQLLKLYSKGLNFSNEALLHAAEVSHGATASFSKELVRRAVVAASLAGVNPGDDQLLAAANQLMSDAESLTRSLLGTSAGDGSGNHDWGGDDPQGEETVGFFSYPPRYGASYYDGASQAYSSRLSINFDAQPGTFPEGDTPDGESADFGFTGTDFTDGGDPPTARP